MAKKGAPSKQKRLSVSPIRHLSRKEFTWTIRPKPGMHTSEKSTPLGFVVRDMLHLTRTARETRQVLNQGHIHVDGKVRKSPQFAVGLFDTISIPTLKKNYRLLLDNKGRLILPEIQENVFELKPAKITNKKWVSGKKLLFQTHDGKTFNDLDHSICVDDSILVETQGKKIKQHLPLAKGTLVLITGGSHVGEVATISHIVEGTMKRRKLVDLTEGKEKFQTTARNVMAIDSQTREWIKQISENGRKAP